MDGYPYLAFTQNTRTLGVDKCTPGSTVDRRQMYLARAENLMLWQIHPDGTYRSTVVEAFNGRQPFVAPITTASPTSSIVTDNMNGMLIPVRSSHTIDASGAAEEFV